MSQEFIFINLQNLYLNFVSIHITLDTKFTDYCILAKPISKKNSWRIINDISYLSTGESMHFLMRVNFIPFYTK